MRRNLRPVGAISGALHAAGITKRKAQAAIVGETDVQWTRYLNGHRSPTCDKVQHWLKTARGNGYPIVLRWAANGCDVYADTDDGQAAERGDTTDVDGTAAETSEVSRKVS